MNLEDFIDRLDGVRRSGVGWMSRCPAHDDRVQSLSLSETDEGDLLLYCQAGCDTSSVLDSLGLHMSDLFNSNEHPDEPEAVYRYEDEQGNHLYDVCRFPDKKFRQRQPDGNWGLGGTRRVLYRLPEVLAANMVYVVEGEKDADAIRESIGTDENTAATCNPMGAGKWREEYTEFLRGREVVIVSDRDEPGRNHAERVAASLKGVATSVEIVLPKAGKDAHDHLKAGFGLDQFIPARSTSKLGGMVIPAPEMTENARTDLKAKPEDIAGYRGPWERYREVEFRPGRLYIMGGYTGDHKSAFALQVFRHLVEQGVRSGYFTLEMPERDIRNRLISHRGIDLWMCDHPWLMDAATREKYDTAAAEFMGWDADIIVDTAATTAKVEQYLIDGEYDFIVFDHLHRMDRDGEESTIARDVKGFKDMALNYNIPVLLISQLRRMPPGLGYPAPQISDFKGSGAIEQEADMALSVYSERGKDGGVAGSGALDLTILKNRHGHEGTRPFWFDPTTGLLRDMDELHSYTEVEDAYQLEAMND